MQQIRQWLKTAGFKQAGRNMAVAGVMVMTSVAAMAQSQSSDPDYAAAATAFSAGLKPILYVVLPIMVPIMLIKWGPKLWGALMKLAVKS